MKTQKNQKKSKNLKNFHPKPILDNHIREASEFDAKELSKIVGSIEEFLFGKKMPRWFASEHSKKAFEDRIGSKKYKHFVYIKDERVVGFMVIKERKNLYQLFVHKDYHRQGIAKKLWEVAKESFDVRALELKASIYAIKVYESFGFVKVGEQKKFLQLKFQAMEYKKDEF